jgi:hypothetical protein
VGLIVAARERQLSALCQQQRSPNATRYFSSSARQFDEQRTMQVLQGVLRLASFTSLRAFAPL